MAKKVDFLYNMRTYFQLLQKYKFETCFALLFVILFEVTSIVDKYLLKLVVDASTAFAAKEMTQASLTGLLEVIILAYLSAIVAKGIFKWVSTKTAILITASIVADLKQRFAKHILQLDYKFHTNHKTGALLSRLMRGCSGVTSMSNNLFYTLSPLPIQTIVVVGALSYFSLTSALAVLVSILLFVGYSLYFQLKQEPSQIALNDCEDAEKARLSDLFTNIEVVKNFGRESAIAHLFSKLVERTKRAQLTADAYDLYTDTGQAVILSFGPFLALFVPLWDFLRGHISLGTLTFAYAAYGNLIGPMYMFVFSVRNFYKATFDFNALFEYGKIEREVKDAPNAKQLKIKQGGVEFKDITFNYGKRCVFKQFTLAVPAHTKVALVGHSGSGKSTLTKLLFRLYDVDEGQVLIDNKDVKDFKQESLRSELSIVPQDCVLFDDTIYNNVAFSKQSASREEILRAMRFAQLDTVIAQMPSKEQTIVGERGIKLSGGEKQRVSIARAILADKKILVLDEATSALDSETEHEIQKDLKRLMQGRTSIIIAHRLSTIMSADQIVVLKKGKIVQQGTHNQLIAQEGEYKKLWGLQRGGYIK